MTEKQMLDFINHNITQQGDEGAINITPLLLAMVEQLFKEPITGVAPIVVNIAEVGEKVGTRTTYAITTPQPVLNTFIQSANDMREKTRLFVEDKGALIGFNMVEIDELSVTGKMVSNDGEFVVSISTQGGQSYFYHEEKITAIPQVTQGEIGAYNRIFGATYDKIEDEYSLLVGATEFKLTPAEMIIVNEEFNKTSTDGNYTAMWANSISPYIRCAPWFDGFHQFNLHSAFYHAAVTTYIDLHTEVLPVVDLTSAFSGCAKLEQISGILDLGENARLHETFKGCTNLRVFKMHNLSSNLDLSDCPMLAYEVFEELITYSTMAAIKIYVHPQVKANIESNPLWVDVREAINRSVNIQVMTK